MAKPSAVKITLTIPVADKLVQWDGKELTPIDEAGNPMEEGTWTVGKALVKLLSVFKPKRPEDSIHAYRLGAALTEAEEQGKDYEVNEYQLGVLRAAWKQNGKMVSPDKQTDMFGVLIIGQLGLHLGIESAPKSEEDSSGGAESVD